MCCQNETLRNVNRSWRSSCCSLTKKAWCCWASESFCSASASSFSRIAMLRSSRALASSSSSSALPDDFFNGVLDHLQKRKRSLLSTMYVPRNTRVHVTTWPRVRWSSKRPCVYSRPISHEYGEEITFYPRKVSKISPFIQFWEDIERWSPKSVKTEWLIGNTKLPI